MDKELTDMKKRLQLLEDKEAIRDVLAQYAFNADLNRMEAFVNLFTVDCVFDVGADMGVWKGREQILKFMKEGAIQTFTNHSQHVNVGCKIDVEGDEATVRGYSFVTVHWQGGYGLYSCSFRTFRMKRIDGRWLIRETVVCRTGDPGCQKLIPAQGPNI